MRIALRIAIMAIGSVLATADPATAEPKRVLLLHSFGPDFAPWNKFASSFRAELDLQSPERIDLYEASLATARFTNENAEAPFADYLRVLFAGRRLDLVVAIGGPAANFFQRHRTQLLPSTPMLLTGLEQRRIASANLTANDAVVATTIDLTGVVENILWLRPETTNVAIVIGNSPNEKYWLEQLRGAFQPFANRVDFTYFNELSFEDMRKPAAALPSGSAIFFALLSVDATGAPHEESKALSSLHAVANAPIFSYVDVFLGRGIVGGPLISVADASRQSAEVALRILRGEPAGQIKVAPIGFSAPKFDWRELRRWDISESRLPPGSEIRFRPPTLWDQYRWQTLAIFAAVLLQAMMIMWLLFERRRRRVAEVESRHRLTEIALMNRSASAGAISASIAHELNQPLGAILSNAEAAEVLLTANPPDIAQLKEILADIRQADQRAGEIIRRMRELLKRSEIARREVDLNEALDGVLHILDPEARKRGVVLSADGVQGALFVRADLVHLQQVMLNLAMNAMDAMANSASAPRRITFQTAVLENGQVEVSVSDTGVGIPADKLKGIFEPFFTTKQHGLGLGLAIVRTIVESYGGRIWVENRLGGGAVFRFTLPLVAARPA